MLGSVVVPFFSWSPSGQLTNSKPTKQKVNSSMSNDSNQHHGRLSTKEGLFSFPWDGTVLAAITPDVHPLIYSYHCRKTFGTMKPSYSYQKTLGPLLKEGDNLKNPDGAVFDYWSGRFILADRGMSLPLPFSKRADFEGNNRVQVFSKDLDKLSTIGRKGKAAGEFSSPAAVVIDFEGNLLVLDNSNHRVQAFDANGKYLYQFGIYGESPGQIANSHDLTIDLDGNVVIVDSNNHRLQKFTPRGQFIKAFGKKGKELGEFDFPVSLCVDPMGNIVVSENYGHRIQVIDPTFTKMRQIGKQGSKPGELLNPRGILVDRNFNIIVADQNNHRIQVFSHEGMIIPLHLVADLSSRSFSRGGPSSIFCLDPDMS